MASLSWFKKFCFSSSEFCCLNSSICCLIEDSFSLICFLVSPVHSLVSPLVELILPCIWFISFSYAFNWSWYSVNALFSFLDEKSLLLIDIYLCISLILKSFRPVLIFNDWISSSSAPPKTSVTSILKSSFNFCKSLNAFSRSCLLLVVSLIIDSYFVNSVSKTLVLNPIDNLASVNESRKAESSFKFLIVERTPLLNASKLPADIDWKNKSTVPLQELNVLSHSSLVACELLIIFIKEHPGV